MDVTNSARYGWPDRAQKTPQPRPAGHPRLRKLRRVRPPAHSRWSESVDAIIERAGWRARGRMVLLAAERHRQ